MSQRYYAQISPGLEEGLARELKTLGARRRQISRGGVSFEGTKKHLYRALHWSRLASRVWVTIAEGSAPNPDALFQRARRAPWASYLSATDQLSIKVALHGGSLAGSGQVESVLWSAIKSSLNTQGIPAPKRGAWGDPQTTQRVLAYLHSGRVELRVDGSGELLHRRGWRTQDGPAPLRPTLAWACLEALDWRPDEPLIDLMCGAGTFSMEALSASLHVPPRRRVHYACMSWPSFDPASWDAQGEPSHPPLFQRNEAETNPELTRRHWVSDLAEESLSLARAHLSTIAVGSQLKIIYTRADATALTSSALSSLWEREAPPPSGLIIANPPYGLRVEDQATGGLSVAQRLCDALPEMVPDQATSWRAGVLLPSAMALKTPPGWAKREALAFSHGGIPVSLWRLQPSI